MIDDVAYVLAADRCPATADELRVAVNTRHVTLKQAEWLANRGALTRLDIAPPSDAA